VLDNYATHKHPKVLGLAGAPSALGLSFHSDLGLLAERGRERLLQDDGQRIRRGAFRSIVDLQAAINAYLAEHNASPKPFVWTKSAEVILAKLDRLPVTSL
jgi:hypothetical protein